MTFEDYQKLLPLKYYDFKYDLQMYPDAIIYIVISSRGRGKTYSALKYSYEHNIPIIYMKRTNDDVAFICRETIDGLDTSPYVPINRDLGSDIRAKLIDNGIGGFWKYEPDENNKPTPEGLPIAYALSLNAIKRVKGFDASRCDWILLDEFIPQIGERVLRSEGELLLDVYMTVSRDREKRGKDHLKLILFANAEDISTPITNTLEVVDQIADLYASGASHYYDPERKIMIHHILESEVPLVDAERSGIFATMANTTWGAKSFGGEFAKNDFSNVCRNNLKGYRGYVQLHYKTHDYYVYINEAGLFYVSRSPTRCPVSYNLNRETEQKAFYSEYAIDLRIATIEDRVKFQSYTMYDLIMNYSKIFNIGR